MIKLFIPYELFVGSMNLMENLPDSRLETCLEVILQLNYVSCPIEDLKIKAKLFKDKQNFLFIAWGQEKL